MEHQSDDGPQHEGMEQAPKTPSITVDRRDLTEKEIGHLKSGNLNPDDYEGFDFRAVQMQFGLQGDGTVICSPVMVIPSGWTNDVPSRIAAAANPAMAAQLFVQDQLGMALVPTVRMVVKKGAIIPREPDNVARFGEKTSKGGIIIPKGAQ